MKLYYPLAKRYSWPLILLSSIVVVYSATVLLSSYAENKIEEKLCSIRVKISSVEVNLSSRSINLKNLEWSSVTDSTLNKQHSVSLRAISLRGIHLYDLLFQKRLLINDIVLDSGIIRYTKNSTQAEKKMPDSKYRLFLVKNISLTNIKTHVLTDTLVDFSALLNGNLGDASMEIDSLNQLHYSLKTIDARAEKISISRHQGMYGGTIARVYINTVKQKIIIDSAELIPNFGKYEFAHFLGKQTGRINLSIPNLTVEGWQYKGISDSSFIASKMEIKSFELLVFKDKRMPFRQTKNVPLPMESFLKLSHWVKIDNLLITNSTIAVEEFPEKGLTTGTVTFDNVQATFVGLNNRITGSDPRNAVLTARGRFMKSGYIKANFEFPLDGSAEYTASGSISKMDLLTLNPVLENAANLRIKSGHLSNMTFDFIYTDFTSTGIVDMAYENLRITGLDYHKSSTNEIKTFLINAFVNNSKVKATSSDQKTGVIDITRDRKRFIFNVWWKSILDGMKSVILGKRSKNNSST